MNVEFKLVEIQPAIFLVTTANQYDLGQLFVCVQEHYESVHNQWRDNYFERATYERWYALNVSDISVFSYPHDWCGFNVPSTAVHSFYHNTPYDITVSYYDRLMLEIDRTIIEYVGKTKPYYLIGVLDDDLETLDHEIAHGMYATSPAYKADMDRLIANLSSTTYARVSKVLTQMGYASKVHKDEIQANFATGLTNHFKGFQRYCPPFIQCFEQHRMDRNYQSIPLRCDV